MIERYSTPQMNKIWSEKECYVRWLLIEQTLNTEIQGKLIPANGLSEQIEGLCVEDLITKSKQLEIQTNHDVVAFLFALDEMCSDGRWAHWGLTSSDVKDSALSLAILDSVSVLGEGLGTLLVTIAKLCSENKGTKICARTHGQIAEATSVSVIFENYGEELRGVLEKLNKIEHKGKLSGSIGSNKHTSKETEETVLNKLGLVRETSPSQVVQRTYHAEIIFTLCLLASLIEKMALQIRLWQQSGIEEISEGFTGTQAGSSAMPHKRNPIDCENLCGISRMVRSYLAPSLENIALWGHRDMTHSSVERVVFPDIFNLTHYSVIKLNKILGALNINEEQINKHTAMLPDSQDKLLELILHGKSRREAYRIVQGGKQ